MASIRKIQKLSGSLMITIPANTAEQLGLKKGDYVNIKIQDEDKLIIEKVKL